LATLRYLEEVSQNELSELLRRSRTERGESLRSAARNLGVDPSFLSRVESGDRRPSDDLQRQIGDYYGIDGDEISLAVGDVPTDVLEILRRNPSLIEQLRAEYGKSD